MENQEQQTISIDDKIYAIADLSESAKYCLQQITDLRGQQAATKAKLDQLTMAENGFVTALQTEIKKSEETDKGELVD